ncbi:MAG: hypothetical protein HKN41_08255 [Ilumatobacter sp.]|nr:hypothetical protein [Ilumatobacter sp.]
MSIDRIPLPPDIEGTLLLCGLRDIATEPERTVTASRIDLVVCLNEEIELAARYPDYHRWLPAHSPERALWFPMQDFTAAGADAARPVLESIVSRLSEGDRVLMHCAMGQGRAGTMATCVLLRLGVPLGEALATVAAHRRHAGPAADSQWSLVEAVAVEQRR